MTGEQEIRRLAGGESVSVGVLRDFLTKALRHDAVADVVLERMAFLSDSHRLDSESLAIAFPELIAEFLMAAGRDDWIAIADRFIGDFRRERRDLEAEAEDDRGAEVSQ